MNFSETFLGTFHPLRFFFCMCYFLSFRFFMFLFCLLSLMCTLDLHKVDLFTVFLYILKAVTWILAQISGRAERCICSELRKWFSSKSLLKICILFSGTIFNLCCCFWVTEAYCCSDSKQNVTLNQMKIFSFRFVSYSEILWQNIFLPIRSEPKNNSGSYMENWAAHLIMWEIPSENSPKKDEVGRNPWWSLA